MFAAFFVHVLRQPHEVTQKFFNLTKNVATRIGGWKLDACQVWIIPSPLHTKWSHFNFWTVQPPHCKPRGICCQLFAMQGVLPVQLAWRRRKMSDLSSNREQWRCWSFRKILVHAQRVPRQLNNRFLICSQLSTVFRQALDQQRQHNRLSVTRWRYFFAS